MSINKRLAHDSESHSAAILTEQMDTAVVKFRQRLSEVVELASESEANCSMTERATLEQLTAGLSSAGAEACRSAFTAIVESRDKIMPTREVQGRSYRFRETVGKDWFTPFGIVTVARRTYASDGHAGRVVPVDDQWGMANRYLTPEVEELVAFASAMALPTEVEQLLHKALNCSPSSTAIKRAIGDVGDFLETHASEIETQIGRDAPLSEAGDSLIVSWDGAMVPIRGSQSVDWKEASIARVSIYQTADPTNPDVDEERTKIIDGRYIARMPESGMTTLIDRLTSLVGELRAERAFEHFALICDGSKSIWKTATSRSEFSGAVQILDFYHAAQHLSAAADAIFGEGTQRAREWFEKRRHDLRHMREAVHRLLRCLRRFLGKLRIGSKAHRVVRRVIKHFKNNRRRMRYREFVDMGLPIGSGPVEAAAKNIVNHRLKRSGMRWSLCGGQRILNLRALVKDRRWPTAWASYRDRVAA